MFSARTVMVALGAAILLGVGASHAAAQATPATPATPANPTVSPATRATRATPPDTAPRLGVVPGSRSGGGPSAAATPEPTTMLLMGAGMAGLYALRRRR